jgi:hypothetical protein
MKNMIKGILIVVGLFAGSSFASSGIIRDIAVETLPSIWEAYDENDLCVYQLEIRPNLSGVFVISKHDDIDLYQIYSIEIIPRDSGAELIIDLKNEEQSIRLCGTGRACEDMGMLRLELYERPHEKSHILELEFSNPWHGTPYIKELYDLSLSASKAREVKWEETGTNTCLSVSPQILPKPAKNALVGLWEAFGTRDRRIFQLEIRPDGKGILVYAFDPVAPPRTCRLRKAVVVEKNGVQEFALDFVKDDGSLVRMIGAERIKDATGGLDFQFDMNPLGEPNTWDLHFIKADESTFVQKLFELSYRAYSARYAEWQKREWEEVEMRVRVKVEVEKVMIKRGHFIESRPPKPSF